VLVIGRYNTSLYKKVILSEITEDKIDELKQI
jgi:hypothetical protein